MLMRFSVSNFMSFGYRENNNGEILPDEFYLYAGRTEKHGERVMHFGKRKVLKFAAVYGANASGKTNLIRAIDTGRRIVLNTMGNDTYSGKYCKSKKDNINKPTLFEYEFTISDKCYAYGFTVNLNKGEVLSEWLYDISADNESTIFERTSEDNSYFFNEEIFTSLENKNRFEFFLQDINNIGNSLLLYEIKRRRLNSDDFDIFESIFDWFWLKLLIIYPETKIGESYRFFDTDNQKLIDILKYFDTGITDYNMREISEALFRGYFPEEKIAEDFLKPLNPPITHKSILNYKNEILFEINHNKNKEPSIYKLLFKHGTDESEYEYGEESDGTKRLIDLLNVILNNDSEKVFIIDEMDRSLHPQMTIKFVETFLKFSQNNNAQLIITTHESNLMDFSILRRDEIWLAEKEQNNTTSLYTLDKFKIRYDKVVEKDYLSGRYGAIPIFKDFEYVWGENNFEKTEFENS